MTAWIDAPQTDCEHEPDIFGVKCQHCGIPAEMVGPDELAEHLSLAIETARLTARGQLAMFRDCQVCEHPTSDHRSGAVWIACIGCEDNAQVGVYAPCFDGR